jgi:hypothetical protein
MNTVEEEIIKNNTVLFVLEEKSYEEKSDTLEVAKNV